jgi:hypothetical protein
MPLLATPALSCPHMPITSSLPLYYRHMWEGRPIKMLVDNILTFQKKKKILI